MRTGLTRTRTRAAIGIAAAAALVLILPNIGANAAAPPTPAGWTPVMIDDFNGPAGTLPDPARWGYDVGGGGFGNGELQNYTNRASNVSTDGAGNLVITARKENVGSCWYGACTHTSGRILTKNKFTQKYGRVEARLKVPAGQGLWPAFWMLGDNIDSVGWPNTGEIDIMEILGHETTKTYGTLHGPGYSGGASIGQSYVLPGGGMFASGFHTFTIDWAPDSIKWYVDGVLFSTKTPADLRGNTWVFDHPFFVILNLAVGGQWPGSPNASTPFPAQYVIDYVATYQASGPSSPPVGSPPVSGSNIAQGKAASASSTLGGNTASAGVDGNTGTRWESVHNVDPQWLQVDLGQNYNISNVTLNWEGAYARAYDVQVSSSPTGPWSNVYSTTTGDGGVDNLTVTGSGRYIRMNGTTRGTPYGYSLWEFSVAGTPATATSGLLSQGKPTTASSTENAGTAAVNATDGNAGTRWASAFSDPQWLQVDLGATKSINKVVLNWEGAYGKAFKIQTSADGINGWTDIYSTTTGAGGVQTLTVTGSGRHVRMMGTARGTGYGYSLWEFQVFGS